MSITNWITKKAKMKKQIDDIRSQANEMFPTESHANTAMRMQHNLDAGQLDPSQYRWNQDVLPWRLSQPHWVDMMSTQEGLDSSQVAQLHSDYYRMNYLPDIMNTPKNIDILIKAAERDKYDKY